MKKAISFQAISPGLTNERLAAGGAPGGTAVPASMVQIRVGSDGVVLHKSMSCRAVGAVTAQMRSALD